MKTSLKILSVIMFLMAYGCAAKSNMTFTEKVLETSEDTDKPKWVFKTFTERKDSFEFSGGVTEISDYALGVSEARAEAIKNGLVSIQIKARSEFSKFAQGSNMSDDTAGKWVGDGIAFIADSLYVSGIKQKQIYYEKVKSTIQYKPHYNIWVLCCISADEYLKAKVDAAQRLINKYQQERNEEAKQKAEELLDTLRQEQVI